MDRSGLGSHLFRERLKALLAEVERAYAGPASHPKVSGQRCS